MSVRTTPTTLLQIFCKTILSSKVIVKKITDPDNIIWRKSLSINGLRKAIWIYAWHLFSFYILGALGTKTEPTDTFMDTNNNIYTWKLSAYMTHLLPRRFQYSFMSDLCYRFWERGREQRSVHEELLDISINVTLDKSKFCVKYQLRVTLRWHIKMFQK